MKTSLPSITKIGYLACSEVSPDILLRYKANIPIVVYGVITPITFFGNPMCDAVSEYENKGRVEHTTLKFSTVDDLPIDSPTAFVVSTAGGRSFLIGTMEQPYPIVKVEEYTGEPNGDTAAKVITVTYSAMKSLIPCTI